MDIDDRRDKLAATPRRFQLGTAPQNTQDQGVVTAGHERDVVVPDRPLSNAAYFAAKGRTDDEPATHSRTVAERKTSNLLDGPDELGPQRNRNVRHSIYTPPAGGNPDGDQRAKASPRGSSAVGLLDTGAGRKSSRVRPPRIPA